MDKKVPVMSSYFSTHDTTLCSGCRACEQECPSGAITMVLDDEGFLYPIINATKCSRCGLCERVCPLADSGYTNLLSTAEPRAFAAQHLDTRILANSTSGGAFTALVDAYCDENYVIFGAAFDDNFVVNHSWITDKHDIQRFRGSKYVQSDTQECFSRARDFLNQGKKVLFSGTPCQIAGLKSFLHVDYAHLLCVDVVCHGVPSLLFFDKYKQYLEKKYKGKIIHINFRDKRKSGWTASRMTVKFSNGTCYSKSGIGLDDSYIKGFLQHYFTRSVCFVCPFARPQRTADITLGDFWGIDDYMNHFDCQKGVSLILANTPKGITLFEKAKQQLIWESIGFERAAIKNRMLLYPALQVTQGERLISELQTQPYSKLVKRYLKQRPLYRRILSATLSHKTKKRIREILKMVITHHG